MNEVFKVQTSTKEKAWVPIHNQIQRKPLAHDIIIIVNISKNGVSQMDFLYFNSWPKAMQKQIGNFLDQMVFRLQTSTRADDKALLQSIDYSAINASLK